MAIYAKKPTEGGSQAEPLDRIADLLDCPVDVFTDGVHAPPDVRQSRELLSLWTAIEDQEDREQVLAFMRQLAKLR